MNLTFFSGAVTAAGIAALAGGLFWLQRLRVRHREVPVVTALFWREAVEETRARELRLRFRHPLAYLFILAICAALWLAAAGLRFEAGSDRSVVLLLDASAGMARGTRVRVRLDLAKHKTQWRVFRADRDRKLHYKLERTVPDLKGGALADPYANDK